MDELFPSEPPKEGDGEWKIVEEKLPSLGERMEEGYGCSWSRTDS